MFTTEKKFVNGPFPLHLCRHIMLLADVMTYKGEILGITRFGVGPYLRCPAATRSSLNRQSLITDLQCSEDERERFDAGELREDRRPPI
jgi:hypothetical protein